MTYDRQLIEQVLGTVSDQEHANAEMFAQDFESHRLDAIAKLGSKQLKQAVDDIASVLKERQDEEGAVDINDCEHMLESLMQRFGTTSKVVSVIVSLACEKVFGTREIKIRVKP